MIRWGEFRSLHPDLAEFGAARLLGAPAYLATVRRTGAPRVHPVTPVITDQGLYVFMEPTSPKGADLRHRREYSIHNGVPDGSGTGGEFLASGHGIPITSTTVREQVVAAASYEPAERYVLFELTVGEARCNGYGDVKLPPIRRWSLDGD